MKGRIVALLVTVFASCMAGGWPVYVVAAPPEPEDCAAESANLVAGNNCGIESEVPDENWEASHSYVTIAHSAAQIHNGSYALELTGTESWPSSSTSAGAWTVKTTNPVAVIGGAAYSFVSWVFIPSAATRVSAARLRVAWYEAADCSGSQLNTATADIADRDSWVYGWLYATAPVNATCAQLRLYISSPADSSGTVGPVYFDNVMFYASSPTALTVRSLSGGSAPWAALPAVGLAMLAGGAVLRRRAA